MSSAIYPTREVVEALRKQYPVGTRVELIDMDDPYTRLVPGDLGTVRGVDDAGSLMIDWDCGSSLSCIFGVDHVRKV